MWALGEEKKPKKQVKPRQGYDWDKGGVHSNKDLSSGEKRRIVSYREEAAQTREKGEEGKERERSKSNSERDRGRERWREGETEEEHMSKRVKEQEGQGRLVARPFMARTRRGRQGVSPGT